MTNVSRRSVAKGAAWSIPAVTLGVGAPAYAASFANVDCTAGAAALSDTGVKSYSSVIGSQTTYDSAHAGLSQKGTYYSLSAGMWQFSAPAPYVTGYKLDASTKIVGITTFSGVTSTGVNNSGMVNTPQVVGAGLAMAFNVQTGVPYTAGTSGPDNWVKGMSIPFCVTWLAGLTPTDTSTTLNTCCYYINYTFNQPSVGSAGVANSGDAYSVTSTPQYGP